MARGFAIDGAQVRLCGSLVRYFMLEGMFGDVGKGRREEVKREKGEHCVEGVRTLRKDPARILPDANWCPYQQRSTAEPKASFSVRNGRSRSRDQCVMCFSPSDDSFATKTDSHEGNADGVDDGCRDEQASH